MFNIKDWGLKNRKERLLRTDKYARDVKRLYSQAVDKLLSLHKAVPRLERGVMFSYDAAGERLRSGAARLFRQLHAKTLEAVRSGMSAEWEAANAATDALLRSALGGAVDKPSLAACMNRNAAARDAFIARRDGGLGLSDRVWKPVAQLREQMEVAITSAIEEGESASTMSRRVRQTLNRPDDLFRRFHYKDAEGNDCTKWKKRVADPESGKMRFIDYDRAAYQRMLGPGVYASSAANAMRVCRTETNMAYRMADHTRWAQLDFVTGVHIYPGPSHAREDVCDELEGVYPKEFVFTGWHPQCYAEGTAVLTKGGWKEFKDVRDDDLICSLNPVTRGIEWVGLTARQRWRKRGRMARFSNRGLECLVTPEHRMVYLKRGSGEIAYCAASEYTQGKGAFYRSCRHGGRELAVMRIGAKEFPFDWFCEFMGYWLSDGSTIRGSQITIAQKDGGRSKPIVEDCLRRGGFRVHSSLYALNIYCKELCGYLKRFGLAKDKYVPEEILSASARQIGIFLRAFSLCDGSRRPPRPFVGSRGTVCIPDGEDVYYYTTSERMAGNLCELVMKTGRRPSYRITPPKVAIKRDGRAIKGNYPLYTIHQCNGATATVFDKEEAEYDGYVYDLTLERNHIMYVAYRGKCFWGSNCFCVAVPEMVPPERMLSMSSAMAAGRAVAPVRGTVQPPAGFRRYVRDNAAKIAEKEAAGTLPYFLRDNRGAVERIVHPPIEERAAARHAARTAEQAEDIKRRYWRRWEPKGQRAEVTEENLRAYLELEKALGVKRRRPMTFAEADHKRPNPHYRYGAADGYDTNCQTDVLAFELRLRGFNVEALPNTAGSALDRLALRPEAAWRTVRPRAVKASGEAGALGRNTAGAMTEDGRYNVVWDWRDGGRGHVVTAIREGGAVRYYDPQNGVTFTDPKLYFQDARGLSVVPGSVRVYRVDGAVPSARWGGKVLAPAGRGAAGGEAGAVGVGAPYGGRRFGPPPHKDYHILQPKADARGKQADINVPMAPYSVKGKLYQRKGQYVTGLDQNDQLKQMMVHNNTWGEICSKNYANKLLPDTMKIAYDYKQWMPNMRYRVTEMPKGYHPGSTGVMHKHQNDFNVYYVKHNGYVVEAKTTFMLNAAGTEEEVLYNLQILRADTTDALVKAKIDWYLAKEEEVAARATLKQTGTGALAVQNANAKLTQAEQDIINCENNIAQKHFNKNKMAAPAWPTATLPANATAPMPKAQPAPVAKPAPVKTQQPAQGPQMSAKQRKAAAKAKKQAKSAANLAAKNGGKTQVHGLPEGVQANIQKQAHIPTDEELRAAMGKALKYKLPRVETYRKEWDKLPPAEYADKMMERVRLIHGDSPIGEDFSEALADAKADFLKGKITGAELKSSIKDTVLDKNNSIFCSSTTAGAKAIRGRIGEIKEDMEYYFDDMLEKMPPQWRREALSTIKEIADGKNDGMWDKLNRFEHLNNINELTGSTRALEMGLENVSSKMPYQFFRDFERELPGFSKNVADKEFFDSLPRFVRLKTEADEDEKSPFFKMIQRYIKIDPVKHYSHIDSAYACKRTVYHEFGHAIDDMKGMSLDAELDDLWEELKGRIRSRLQSEEEADEILNYIRAYKKAPTPAGKKQAEKLGYEFESKAKPDDFISRLLDDTIGVTQRRKARYLASSKGAEDRKKIEALEAEMKRHKEGSVEYFMAEIEKVEYENEIIIRFAAPMEAQVGAMADIVQSVTCPHDELKGSHGKKYYLIENTDIVDDYLCKTELIAHIHEADKLGFPLLRKLDPKLYKRFMDWKKKFRK